MKKITFLMLCLLTVAFANAQLNSVAIVGDGAGGWPGEAGNPGPADVHQMTSTDNIHWSISNLTLTSGSVKFRGNNSWDLPYNWGGSAFPSGTANVDGNGITSIAGTYNVTFNSNTFAYNFVLVTGGGLASVALVGDGAGGWPGEAGNPGPTDLHQMGTVDGVNWTLNNVSLTVGSVKFRGNNSWDLPYNWGGSAFPSGTGTVDGPGITSTAGQYNVTFNSTTFAYNFQLVGSGASSIAIVGDGAGGWPGEAGNPGPVDIHQMTSADGINWTLNNLTLTDGSVKFRGNNSWDLPYNWGGSTFPSGTAVVDANGMTSVAGVYNVTFNSVTRVYNFDDALSIDEQNASVFKIYPNPTENVWNFTSAASVIEHIEVVDILGKTVAMVKPNMVNAQVDASHLSNGIYIAKVVANDATATIRLVKK